MTTKLDDNPLVKLSNLQDQAVPFDKIESHHFLPAHEFAISQAKENIEKIKSSPADFANTCLGLETSSDLMSYVSGIFHNLHYAEANEEIQKLAPEISSLEASFFSDVVLDEVLFKKVKSVYEKKASSNLDEEQLRLLENQYKHFVRNGALLNDEGKEKIRAIDQELSKLGPSYSKNVLQSTNDFELWITDKKDLSGLPDSAIEAASLAATEKNKPEQWLFTLQAPSFIPFLKFADNESLRFKIWKAYNSRAFTPPNNNQSLVLKIANLRHQRAQILSFENHAQFVLAERMAKTPLAVTDFLNNLYAHYKPAAEKDLNELKTFKKSFSQTSSQTSGDDINPWDFAYYSNKLQEKKLEFNDEILRPYFNLENVIEGVFQVAKKLFDLSFTKITDVPVYHKDVAVYKVEDSKTGDYIGLFYTDFFPRPTKKGGAWATDFRTQGISFDKNRRPHASIVCNFTKPTKDKPSLITFNEATTLFHEFGHAIHGLLSQCKYPSLSGNHVLWDFVELPSQIMENWMKEKECLNLFAKHHETGELISDDLIEKIKSKERFQAGFNALRQLNYCFLDMAWHNQDPSKITDVVSFERDACAKTSLFNYAEGTNSSVSFSHIFDGGYSAGYYGYKWAEVLDADAFELFQENGVFDKSTAEKFKDNILCRGNTKPPDELYRQFRGREPKVDALLKREGIL